MGPHFENHTSMYLLVSWNQICQIGVKHIGQDMTKRNKTLTFTALNLESDPFSILFMRSIKSEALVKESAYF